MSDRNRGFFVTTVLIAAAALFLSPLGVLAQSTAAPRPFRFLDFQLSTLNFQLSTFQRKLSLFPSRTYLQEPALRRPQEASSHVRR